MDETYHAGPIHDDLCRHPPKLEQACLLAIQVCHYMIRIGQANERQIVFRPVGAESISIIRSGHYNFRPSRHELIIVLTQLRHVPSAEWSDKAAIEDEYDILRAVYVRELKE